MKEAFLSWMPSGHLIPTLLSKPQCIESPGIQRDVWTGTQPSCICKKVCHTGTHPQGKMMYSTPELLAKEMDYLHKVLCRNSYPYWLLKKPNTRPQMIQASTQENKKVFFSVPYIQGLSKAFTRFLRTLESKKSSKDVTH